MAATADHGAERKKVAVWDSYIRAGLAARRAYDRQAQETLEYFRSHHARLYREAQSKFLDFTERGLCISVNKPAMIRSVLGPHLYQRNPVRTVNAKTLDPIRQAEAAVLSAYLNYSPREAGLEAQTRKAVDDALLRGRGFLRTGYDRERQVVTSWYFPSTRVVIDPAAECLDDAHWIALRTRAPLWAVRRRFGRERGERWRLKGLKGGVPSLREPEEEAADRPEDEQVPGSYLQDLVEYWEVYSKMGAGLLKGPEAPGTKEGAPPADDEAKDFVKLVIARSGDGSGFHRVPLYEGEWDCPLYLDREWPVVALDLVPGIDQLWPESIFGQALSHAKAIDLTSTLRMWGCRTHSRDIYLVHPDAFGGNEFNRLCDGGPSEVIPLKALPAGLGLNQVLHRVDLGAMTPEIAEERAWHEAEFERQTGVTAILHGGDNSGAQERSATASNLRSRAANARLGDLLARVEEWCTRVARNEAIAVRLGDYVSEDEIAKTIGELDLGWLVSVQGAGELPLRDLSTDSERQSRRDRGEPEPLTLQAVLPAAAAYFPDEETAAQAANEVLIRMTDLAMAGDPRALAYATPTLAAPGFTFDVQPRRVEVADVWRDTAGSSPRDLMGEFTYAIEAGTTQRVDEATKRQFAELMLGQIVPQAIQAGDVDFANWALKTSAKSYGLPSTEHPPPLRPAAPAPALPAPAQPQAGAPA